MIQSVVHPNSLGRGRVSQRSLRRAITQGVSSSGSKTGRKSRSIDDFLGWPELRSADWSTLVIDPLEIVVPTRDGRGRDFRGCRFAC